MIHFFCSTPLQIFTAAIIANRDFNKEQCVLYIIDYFRNAETYPEKLENTKLFNEVRLLKMDYIYKRIKSKSTSKLARSFWKLYYYCGYRSCLRSLGISVNDGDSVFFSYLEPICLMLTNLNHSYKMGIHFCGFEDGIGAYTLPLDREETLVEHILSHSPYYKKEKYWVFHPEYVIEANDYKNRLMRIDYDPSSELNNELSCLWDIDIRTELNKKLVLFDDTISNSNYEMIAKEIIGQFGSELLVKKHPRRTQDRFYEDLGAEIMQPQDIPFEKYLLHYDTSNKVLINIFSSAVINSFFIFNQRPFMIFLYKIVDDDNYLSREKELDSIIQIMKDAYKDMSYKIMVPDSIDELMNQLRKLS